jgi:hypothetical protein
LYVRRHQTDDEDESIGMSMFALLGIVVAALNRSGIDHMVSGSVASARHGAARATQDIDIVIDPTPDRMATFLSLLAAADLYVGDGMRALAERSQFNVIDSSSGWKVDLIICKDRPYSRTEFDRRRPATIGDVEVFIVTPEDSILSKLEWGRLSGSERQRRDVGSMLAVQGPALDWPYLRHWANELGLGDLLAEAGDATAD